MPSHYFWSIPTDSPQRFELIHAPTAEVVAVVVADAIGNWHWSRSTSAEVHGASPAAGSAANREIAQQKVLQDLPTE